MTIFITNPDGVITTDKPTSGGGGATTLEELTDVNITAPLNDGEVILYDALETKWVNDGLAEVAYTGAFGDLSDTPTTLGGYGITDAQPVDGDLTAIAALVGTSGLLKKTDVDTWSLDTTTYLTSSSSIKDLGDVYDSMTPANQDVLMWDNVNSRWTNSDIIAQMYTDIEAALIAINGE